MVSGAGGDGVEAQLRRQADLDGEVLAAVPRGVRRAPQHGGELGKAGEGEAAWHVQP